MGVERFLTGPLDSEHAVGRTWAGYCALTGALNRVATNFLPCLALDAALAFLALEAVRGDGCPNGRIHFVGFMTLCSWPLVFD